MLAASGMPPLALPPTVLSRLRERIAAGKLELPILSEAAAQVMRLVNDPTADLRRLAEIVARDPVLAGNLVRVGSSARYAGLTQTTGIGPLVERLGMKAIRELALTLTCEAKVFRVPGFADHMRQLLRHSLAAALFAERLAPAPIRDQAYLCALLHDVGQPVLLQTLVELHAEVGEEPERAALEASIQPLHPLVGAALLRGWGLDEASVAAVRLHHDPQRVASDPLTAAVAVADDCSHFALGPKYVDRWSLGTHPGLAPLGLTSADLDKVIGQASRIVCEVDGIFPI